MSYTVNPELLSLAKRALFEKSAVVPPGGGMDPAAMAQGAVPPADPMQAAMGAAPPPGDPAAAGAAPPGMMDPTQMGGLPPAPPAPPAAAGAPAGQKLKPEQMMQMLDYRLYNMQQQLTAIMNAMGVQVAPESLVLPPGTTGAPPAETALPGGPMAPPPPAAPAGGDPAAMGGDPAAMGGDPAAMGGDPAAAAGGAPKMANWWDRVDHAATSIGRPIDPRISSTVGDQPVTDLQTKASAVAALCRSLTNHAG
jgi:hypothetical protein